MDPHFHCLMNTYDYQDALFQIDPNLQKLRELKEMYISFNVRNAGHPMDARIELDDLIGKYYQSGNPIFFDFAKFDYPKKPRGFLHEAYFLYNESTRFASNANHRRYPCSQLGPGTLASHERSCLVLLRSRPDTVHRFPLRKTQTSTPLTRGSPTIRRPQSNQHPCYSGLQVQDTANSPAVWKF